jgi:uncharacterized protein (DUF1499 family)
MTIGASAVAACFLIGPFSSPPTNLGAAGGKLAECPDSPNCVCSQAQANSPHYIAPLAFKSTVTAAMEKLRTTLERLKRVTIIEARDGYIRAEFRTTVLRFVDDVEFLAEPETKNIHVRSASRVGRSDLGVNRSRVEVIRAAFESLDP